MRFMSFESYQNFEVLLVPHNSIRTVSNGAENDVHETGDRGRVSCGLSHSKFEVQGPGLETRKILWGGEGRRARREG